MVLIFTALIIVATILVANRYTRFPGYLIILLIWEMVGKVELSYTEVETCLNDIIILLVFILFEVWNRYTKE